MKQLIIHDNEKIIDVFTGLRKVVVKENNVTWDNGELSNIQKEFMIVDNQEEILKGDLLSNYTLDISEEDFRSESQKKDEEILSLQKENASLIMDSMQKDIAIQQAQSDHASLMMELVMKGVI